MNNFGADEGGKVAGFVSEDILLSEIFHQINCQASAALQEQRNMFKPVLPADRGMLIALPRFS